MKKLGFLNTLLKCNLFIYKRTYCSAKTCGSKSEHIPSRSKEVTFLVRILEEREISIILAISVLSNNLDQDKQVLK